MARTLKTKTQGEIRGSSPLAEEIRRARKAKRAGIGREEYIKTSTDAIRRVGREEKWGAASIAMSCADVTIASDEVYRWKEVLAERQNHEDRNGKALAQLER